MAGSPDSPDFRRIFESAPGLYLVLTPELQILAVSDAYLAATMTRREDIVGQPIFDVFPDNPADPLATGVSNLRASLVRVVKGRRVDTMAVQKYDIRRPESEGGGFEERFWSPVNSPVLGAQGELDYIIHRVEDVTEFVRLQAQRAVGEELTRELRGEVSRWIQELQDANERLGQEKAALARSEEMLRLLVERVEDYAIFMLDPEGRIVSWNLGAERLEGYRADEVLGRHFSIFYPPDAIAAGKPPEELRVAAARGRVEDEGWRVRKDGSRFVANVVITALRDDRGALRGFAKVTRDVTERFTAAERALARSEAQLGLSEARFRALADNIAQLAWMADETGWIFWYNKRWFDYTGTTLEEMQGWGWKQVHHPEHVEHVTETWRRALEAGLRWEDTFPLRGHDGRYRWFLSRAFPVHDAAGKVLLWFGTNTDVTSEREAQEVLADAVRARDVFLSIASHELKTPLTPLLLQLQGLRRMAGREGDAVPRDALLAKVGKAEKQVTHLARLVGNLLDVSRLSEKRLELDLQPMDLHALVREVVERMRPDFQQARVAVIVRAGPDVTGRWDRFRLDQVITNLLTNALKYGRGAPVEVELDASAGEVTVAVRDRGIGISEADQARIFGRFERAVPASHYGGFGLGLWIARQVVEAMGGRIEVQSRLEEGSQFKVTLPRDPPGSRDHEPGGGDVP